MKNEIATKFPREAAVLELEKVLEKKKKGDHITSAEVKDATGLDITSMRGRIRTWAKRSNLVLAPVPGDGYRIMTDAEHVDASRRAAESAAKKEREALRRLVVTDPTKLDDQQVRRHEWMMPRVAARVARADQDIKETRREFKLTERAPLRVLAGKS